MKEGRCLSRFLLRIMQEGFPVQGGKKKINKEAVQVLHGLQIGSRNHATEGYVLKHLSASAGPAGG